MTINERVSPKRLAEIIARAEVCDDSVLTDYRDIESIARELQQYRAATACPAVWVRYGDANHAPDCTLDNDEAREWVARGLDVVRMVSPINAAPQVTSVPDEMTYEQAREITSKKSFLVDRDSPASLFASGYNACRMDVYLAAPSVQQVASVPDGVARAIEKLRQDLVNCNRYNYCFEAVNQVENACRADMLAAPAVQAEQEPVTDAEHVASVLEMIGSFEPDDIDSDTVDLRFEMDGMDTGSDVSITEYVTRGAAIIRQLSGNTEQVSQPYTLPDDKQRLDWLDAQNKRLNEYYGTAYGWKFDANFQRNAMMLNDSNYPVMNVRQAIDEAMRTATRLQESQEIKK
ncbi:hypothetical protein ATHEMM101B_00960 [Atlantibacter hermannii]|uniref:hypothetical protein n=1 Tax=Atlantibacter hermannii TaxID=565 RepID=UPI0028A25E66|nr:hypothetical protein [Atlantibacter hermannii]